MSALLRKGDIRAVGQMLRSIEPVRPQGEGTRSPLPLGTCRRGAHL